jgi:hypothetical protein
VVDDSERSANIHQAWPGWLAAVTDLDKAVLCRLSLARGAESAAASYLRPVTVRLAGDSDGPKCPPRHAGTGPALVTGLPPLSPGRVPRNSPGGPPALRVTGPGAGHGGPDSEASQTRTQFPGRLAESSSWQVHRRRAARRALPWSRRRPAVPARQVQ